LGMLVSLADRYHVRSNRESGYGRYDVMLIPHDTTKVGIVIEFKKVDIYEHETLEQAAANALVQIKDKQYVQEMHALGISSTVLVGIAFEGKKVLIQYEHLKA
ncbi:MAG: PD-(D/E)XK nuclease domain-containing protein, partial [Candidatus Dependentiae bacterium]|nr:PD-(D/E)XK nuclease domain-containing protein [Candidatus Dependentiae bacterium]